LRALKREGKIRAWGAAFGPAIGWLYEAVELMERERDIDTIQMIWNILEQHPGSAMIEAARVNAPSCCFNIRVTHASGMLAGKYGVVEVPMVYKGTMERTALSAERGALSVER